MKKEDFLNELNSYLSVLRPEDRKNTIEFYEEYFEDAEDESQAIDDLGYPKKLAEQIIDFHKNIYKDENVKLSAEFNTTENISEIILNITAASVVITAGQCEKIEYTTENISANDFSAKIENGKLIIKEKPALFFSKKKLSSFLGSFSMNVSVEKNIKRKINIYIPNHINLEKLECNAQLGSLKIENISVNNITGYTTCGGFAINLVCCNNIDFNTSAGAIKITEINTNYIKLSSSAGSIKFDKIKAKEIIASTGAGSIGFIDTEAEFIKANSGAGNITSKILKVQKGAFNTGAGNNRFMNSELTDTCISTGAGSIKFQGSLYGTNKICSSIGSINIDLERPLYEHYIKIYSDKNTITVNDETITVNYGKIKLGNIDSETKINLSTKFGKIRINTDEGK